MMIIFNFIFSIIIILIIYFLISSILKYLLKIFNKYEYKNYCLFLPTFLAMGTWSLGFLMWYFTLTYLMNIDIIKIIISFIIKEPSISNQVLIVSFIYWILCLLIQNFAFMTININYKKIIGNTRFTFKKLFLLPIILWDIFILLFANLSCSENKSLLLLLISSPASV